MEKCIKKVILTMIQPGKCPVSGLSSIQVVRRIMFHSNMGGTEPCQQSLRLMRVNKGSGVSAR